MEMVLLLGTIISQCHLSLVPGESVVPHASATLQLNPNPRMIVTQRRTCSRLPSDNAQDQSGQATALVVQGQRQG
jgi:hypothetical protein